MLGETNSRFGDQDFLEESLRERFVVFDAGVEGVVIPAIGDFWAEARRKKQSMPTVLSAYNKGVSSNQEMRSGKESELIGPCGPL